MLTIATVLALVALVFGVIDLIRSRGQSLTCWAIVLLALALLWPIIR